MTTKGATIKRVLALLSGSLLAVSFSAAAADVSYTVRKGDNPWNISARYLNSMDLWPKLVKYNRITQAQRIPPGSLLRIPVAWLAHRSASATALAVKGNVLMTDAQGRQSRIKVGDQIPEGAIIHTGAEDNVSLSLFDNSRVLVKGNSEFRLDANAETLYGKTRNILLDLRQGALENQVEKLSSSGGRFEIRTPAAIAAVRGTSFRVAANALKTTTEVIQGDIHFANEVGMVDLAAGYATSATVQGAPEPARPLLSAPDLSGLPPRIERVPADLPIPAQAGAHAFRTQISADAHFATLLFDQVTALPVARIRDLPDADYHLRVRAVDKDGFEGFDAQHRLTIDTRPRPTVDTRPKPPSLIVPANGAKLTETQPVFGWAGRHDAAGRHYRIQVARDASFDNLVLDRRDVLDDHFRLSDKLPVGAYFWRIAAIDPQHGQGPFGTAHAFRRVPALPVMEVQTKEMRTAIRWQPGWPDERLQLQVARAGTFAEPVVDVTLTTSDNVLPTLLNGTYLLRARPIAGDGFVGDWGVVHRIEMKTVQPTWMLLLAPLLLGL